MELLVEQFDEIEDSYLRERKHDVVQVVERVLKALMGKARKVAKRGKDEDMSSSSPTTCRPPTPSSSSS